MIGRALLAVAIASGAAAAEPIDLGPAGLTLDDTWHGPAPTEVRVVRQREAATLVVARYPVPNVEAWRDSTRGAHVDAIVAGFATAGWTIDARAVARLGKAAVPTVDVTLSRTRGAERVRVAVRILLFRTMTWTAIAGGAADRAVLIDAARGLTPD